MSDSSGWDYDFWILGEPASAKNQRRIIKLKNGQPRIIKSAKALAYGKSFQEQCVVADPLMEGDVAILLDTYYASRRPDLAATDLIKDLLQGFLYSNDRQVKAECALWNIDKENPRVRVRLKEINFTSFTGASSLELSEIWGMAKPGK